jgi:hypothetical protein
LARRQPQEPPTEQEQENQTPRIGTEWPLH